MPSGKSPLLEIPVDATLTLVEDFLTSHGLTAVREQSTTANPVLVADLNETAPSAPLILFGPLGHRLPGRDRQATPRRH